ncbi:phosphopantetheine-binding protein [Streptomyces demainii]|uniref:Aryl carrier-like protein n=1 Tax=Streptomyces demainii TaxID=588122 RepID=A0ABT9KWY8_9ACTN|nr:phosphopantetheine-binding protein [Streptomyces demainii]MDP9612954.1 aryl carrier-like protein [Streptomyces demainii]
MPQAELAELWAQVLEVPAGTIGPGDDFFALGGDSIRLGRLVGWIARACGVLLPLADALAARTLAAMSEAVRTQVAGPYRPISARITGTANLHPHQRGLYALWQADPDSLAYNIPVRVDILGPLAPTGCATPSRPWSAATTPCGCDSSWTGGPYAREPRTTSKPSFAYREAEPGATAIGDFVRPFAADRPPHLRALLVRTARTATSCTSTPTTPC